MPELDRPPQARAESLLLLELELALGREHADERRRRDESAGEEDLAELLPRPARLLLGERGCELVFGDELVRQEELTQAGAARAGALPASPRDFLERAKHRALRAEASHEADVGPLDGRPLGCRALESRFCERRPRSHGSLSSTDDRRSQGQSTSFTPHLSGGSPPRFTRGSAEAGRGATVSAGGASRRSRRTSPRRPASAYSTKRTPPRPSLLERSVAARRGSRPAGGLERGNAKECRVRSARPAASGAPLPPLPARLRWARWAARQAALRVAPGPVNKAEGPLLPDEPKRPLR